VVVQSRVTFAGTKGVGSARAAEGQSGVGFRWLTPLLLLLIY
jgi:hypothetical protein